MTLSLIDRPHEHPSKTRGVSGDNADYRAACLQWLVSWGPCVFAGWMGMSRVYVGQSCHRTPGCVYLVPQVPVQPELPHPQLSVEFHLCPRLCLEVYL